MKTSPLLRFLFIFLIAGLFFKVPGFFGLPIPLNLLFMYMFFVAVVSLLVLTSSPDGMEGFLVPLRRIFFDKRLRARRNAVLTALPIIAALLTYLTVGRSGGPEAVSRSVHTAPPHFMRAYGKTYNLQTLDNPLRRFERKEPARFKGLVREGGEIYFKNCFFCHGALLDGHGHLSAGMSPAPLPFRGHNTIAQLRESYLFWRIVKGGAGLPAEAAPWDSVMPSWESTLTEDQIWKTILFLYDYTGNRPLKWK